MKSIIEKSRFWIPRAFKTLSDGTLRSFSAPSIQHGRWSVLPLVQQRLLSSKPSPIDQEGKYHDVADQTLEELFDLLSPLEVTLDDFDMTLAQGVLTIKLGSEFQNKTWVINKQTPNRQIWWSSPISGPRRYEYFSETVQHGADHWKYTRDQVTSLKQSLVTEIENITKVKLT